MIPLQTLVLKEHIGDGHKHRQTYALLYHLQLDEAERAAIAGEAYPVGRYLTAVFEEGYAPREHYDAYQWP